MHPEQLHGELIHMIMGLSGEQANNCPHFFRIAACMWKTQHFSMVTACKKDLFSTFPFRQNDDERMAGDSLFCWISGIIGTSEKKGDP